MSGGPLPLPRYRLALERLELIGFRTELHLIRERPALRGHRHRPDWAMLRWRRHSAVWHASVPIRDGDLRAAIEEAGERCLAWIEARRTGTEDESAHAVQELETERRHGPGGPPAGTENV